MSKDSDDLIRRGLEERARQREGRASPLENLQGLPRDLAAILEMGRAAEAKAARCNEFYSGITSALVEFERVEKARLSEIAFTFPADREKHLKQAVAQKRKEILAVSGLAADRERVRGELAELKAKAVGVRAMYADPVVVLTRGEITSEKAQRYRDALRNSGPVEIRAMLETAISTNDRSLAAALFSRLDALPDDDRRHVGISKKDVALILAGPESRGALAACDNVSLLADKVEMTAAQTEGREIPSDTRIAIGLRERDLARDIENITNNSEPKDAAE
jgi:hypothetical protein